MGLFNIVRVPTAPDQGETEVQFKWGDCWANRYLIGDKIEPSEGDKGTISVPGIGGLGFYRVNLKEWVIESVEKISQDEWNQLDAAIHD